MRPFPDSMRTVLITDSRGGYERLLRLCRAALAGGIRALQIREPVWSAAEVARACETLLPDVEACGGLLLVNDRADVAAAGLAHGVHLGTRSLRPDQVRPFVGERVLIGFSAHGGAEIEAAARQGADYVSLSPVWPTSSKPGAAALGPELARRLTAAAPLPVVWLGGIDAARVPECAAAAGIAVVSAVCAADDPTAAAAALVAARRATAVGEGASPEGASR